jgi:pimeloyl-ACP methyl ester carboxylesterase
MGGPAAQLAQLTPHPGQARTFDSPGGPLAAIDAGPAKAAALARAVIFVPGFTGSKEDFAPLIQPLSDAGYRVLAYDQRGQHESAAATAGPDTYEIRALARDLLAIAGAVAAETGSAPHLVGHSFGGLVARAAVLGEPSRFASLTLLDSGPAAIPGWRRDMLIALEPVMAQGHGAVFAAMQVHTAQAVAQGRAQASKYESAAPELLAFLRERFLGTDAQSLQGMGDALLSEPDRTDELRAAARSAALPLMVVYGTLDDAWPPRLQEQMAARLGAVAVAIPGVGHSPGIEDPAALCRALIQFWEDSA